MKNPILTPKEKRLISSTFKKILKDNRYLGRYRLDLPISPKRGKMLEDTLTARDVFTWGFIKGFCLAKSPKASDQGEIERQVFKFLASKF